MAKVASKCLGCGQSIWQAAAHGDPAGLQSGFSKLEYILRLWGRAAVQLQMPLLIAVIPGASYHLDRQRLGMDGKSDHLSVVTRLLLYAPAMGAIGALILWRQPVPNQRRSGLA